MSLIAAAPQKVSERTRCHFAMPWFRESASPDPALRRSDSPPLSSARDAEIEERGGRSKRVMGGEGEMEVVLEVGKGPGHYRTEDAVDLPFFLK